MQWNITSDRPVYLQLAETIQNAVISGEFSPGDKLPSVRDFASQAGVNPNTMQKALAELEKLDIVYSRRTAGRFITEDKEKIKEMKYEKAADEALRFLTAMRELGLDRSEVVKLLDSLEKEEEEDEHESV